MGKSTRNQKDITFSAGAEVFLGDYGTAFSALPKLGLLGQNATLSVAQEFRQKMDHYPQVTVAEAIQSQALNFSWVTREWRTDTLQLAFNLGAADITPESAGDQQVVDEEKDFSANSTLTLDHPLKAGESVVLTSQDGATTYTPGDDYVTVARDNNGQTLLYRVQGGAIAAQGEVKASYTYTQTSRTLLPIGRRSSPVYRSIKLVEDFTNGAKMEMHIFRARVGIPGDFNINSADSGGDIPLAAQALFDTDKDALAFLYNYDAPA